MGLVGGLALVIGAVAALTLRASARSVAFVMAFGAGVLISAVAYDLTQEAFELGGGGSVAAGLAGGSVPDAFRESGNSIAVGVVTVLGFALAALLTSA